MEKAMANTRSRTIGFQRREIVACPGFRPSSEVFTGHSCDADFGRWFQSIGFFYAQLAASRTTRPSSLSAPRRKDRNFVDHGGGSWAFDAPARMREVFTCKVADDFRSFVRYAGA